MVKRKKKRKADKEQRRLQRKFERRQVKIDKAIKRVTLQYLNANTPFPILLEDAYLALGYKSEGKALKGLYSLEFTEGQDYLTKQGKQRILVRLTRECLIKWAEETNSNDLLFSIFPEDEEEFPPEDGWGAFWDYWNNFDYTFRGV
ncbi:MULTISPECIES: hypothetical protein [unclassified Moorena]|uniref:hypothetical protein n=1 Tax=unclassified Moorena TaxID=2683338 RepID=UPI0013CCDDE0|nr:MULTISPECIES: hypothetical protein [unclassified Moorena]NEO22238.1 hypothetical protein [Moorena sp. SIO4A5]NEP23737.1 hypothetical protein [Moorena sp. SIO3I6]